MRKIYAGLLTFLEIVNFCNFLKKFFKIFQNSPASGGGGSAPGPPTIPTPKMFTRTEILAAPLGFSIFNFNIHKNEQFLQNNKYSVDRDERGALTFV